MRGEGWKCGRLVGEPDVVQRQQGRRWARGGGPAEAVRVAAGEETTAAAEVSIPSLAHSWSSVGHRLGCSCHLYPASVVPIGESCGNQGAPKAVAEAGAGGGAGSTDVTADPRVLVGCPIELSHGAGAGGPQEAPCAAGS